METWLPHSILICWGRALYQGDCRVVEEWALELLAARIATIVGIKVAIKKFWRRDERISQVWVAVPANHNLARSCQCELSIISSHRASARDLSSQKTHMRLIIVIKTAWIGLFWCLSRYHKLSQMFQIWTLTKVLLDANRAVVDPHSLKNTQKISVKRATRRRKSIRRKDTRSTACKTHLRITNTGALIEWMYRRSLTLNLSTSMIICLMANKMVLIKEIKWAELLLIPTIKPLLHPSLEPRQDQVCTIQESPPMCLTYHRAEGTTNRHTMRGL